MLWEITTFLAYAESCIGWQARAFILVPCHHRPKVLLKLPRKKHFFFFLKNFDSLNKWPDKRRSAVQVAIECTCIQMKQQPWWNQVKMQDKESCHDIYFSYRYAIPCLTNNMSYSEQRTSADIQCLASRYLYGKSSRTAMNAFVFIVGSEKVCKELPLST